MPISTSARYLRELFAQDRIIRVMGVHDGLSSLLAQNAGYDAVWASGLGISASHGVPDASVLTMTELLGATDTIAAATDLPVIADCDAGFGDVNAIVRLVRKFEARGIAAVCIEDKQHPKRNSFRHEQHLVSKEEFSAKIAMAADARRNSDFLIIARTEALIAGTGLNDALARARLYQAAGADAILVHSRATSAQEVFDFSERWHALDTTRVPLIAIPTTFSSTSEEELSTVGIQMVIYANQALRAAVLAMQRTMEDVAAAGTSLHVQPGLISLEDLFRLIGTADHEGRERKFLRLMAELRSRPTPDHIQPDRA